MYYLEKHDNLESSYDKYRFTSHITVGTIEMLHKTFLNLSLTHTNIT